MTDQYLHKSDLVKTIVERISHLQKNKWVDEKTTAVLMQFNLHRRDTNVFIHVSILYEKLGQQYVLQTSVTATDIQALFFYPDEAAIKKHTDLKQNLFYDDHSKAIATVAGFLCFLAIITLIYETEHIGFCRFFTGYHDLLIINCAVVFLYLYILVLYLINSKMIQEGID